MKPINLKPYHMAQRNSIDLLGEIMTRDCGIPPKIPVSIDVIDDVIVLRYQSWESIEMRIKILNQVEQ